MEFTMDRLQKCVDELNEKVLEDPILDKDEKGIREKIFQASSILLEEDDLSRSCRTTINDVVKARASTFLNNADEVDEEEVDEETEIEEETEIDESPATQTKTPSETKPQTIRSKKKSKKRSIEPKEKRQKVERKLKKKTEPTKEKIYTRKENVKKKTTEKPVKPVHTKSTRNKLEEKQAKKEALDKFHEYAGKAMSRILKEFMKTQA